METDTTAYAVKLTDLGFQIRQPDGNYYNGIWHARRIAQMACKTLNEGKQLPIAEHPDRLIRDERKVV